MSRRKGTPCACNSDPCGCGGSRSDCIKTVNNEYPDPNRNLEIKAGAGIQIVPADHGIEIINISDPDAFIAGDNIEIIDNADGTRKIRLKDDIVRTGDTDLTGDVAITGDLSVNGNIVQNGAYYDTHAEHIYTTDDYIIMRDGAISALSAGDYSGFQVKLYDGVNDGRLVIDNTGTARVGDVGDEQPLLTREEAANLNDGALLKWDAANSKAVDEGTVGDDTKPIKIVNGVATAVTKDVINTDGGELSNNKNIRFNVSPYNPPILAYANGNHTYLMSVLDNNDRSTTLATFYINSSGLQVNIVAMLRNSDGTYRYTTIA